MCERIVAKTSVRMLLSLLLIFGSVNPAMSVLRKGETSLGTSFESYFPLKEIRLSDGPFLDLQQKGKEYLLWLNPDSLLHFYRIEAGLSSKAGPYAGWESQDVWGAGPLRGGFLGFYLSSVSMMYQSTGDRELLRRLKYVLKELKLCQEAGKDGFLLGVKGGRELFREVASGKIKTNNPTVNGAWAPVYLINKMLLGLSAAYTQCDLKEALPILVRLADWFGSQVLDKLTDEQIQQLLICEHGSINESYVEVYELTGQKRFLDWARRLNHRAMWVPLSEGKDMLFGWHANTQIPKFTGFNAVYRYTNNKAYNDAATRFWDIVVQKHTWINGGNSTGEHFFEESMFEKKIPQYGGPESCNSVNMMRLTESLYQTDGRVDRIDYYERVLYNHILANYDPEEGMCVYYTPMRPGHYKIYGTRYHSFWCCTGTGFEAPAKFAKMIYAHKDNSLYVNMFIASTLDWNEKNIMITQSTNFPDEDQTLLTIKSSSTQQIDLKIRIPFWIKNKSMVVRVNNKIVKGIKSEKGYVTISREWSDGDEIKVTFTPLLEIVPLKNSERYLAMTYGPIVLATKIDNTNIGKEEFRHERKTVSNVMIPMSDTPVLFGTLNEIKGNIRRVVGKELLFIYNPKEGKSVKLVPYNRINFSRYAIYMIHVDDKEEYIKTVWDGSYYVNMNQNLGTINVDAICIGDTDSERMHKIEQVSNITGKYDYISSWRRAVNGGYFMYNLASLPDKEQTLYIAFRGNDQDEFAFDLLIDGQVIKSFVRSLGDEGLVTKNYAKYIPIPFELTRGKKNITLKIAARLKNMTGDIFDIRILPSNSEMDLK